MVVVAKRIFNRNLGEILTHYYLKSSQYVSDRVLKMVDDTSNSMVESGIHQFYKTFGAFNHHFITVKHSNQDENEEFSALNMQQIQRLLILFICFWAFASLIFIGEMVVVKVMRRSSANQMDKMRRARQNRHRARAHSI